MQTEQELTSGYAQEVCETPALSTETLINPEFEEATIILPLQGEIDTLLNLADLISTRIVVAKSLKADTSKLISARGWTLDLAKVLGNQDPYQFIPEKQPRQLIGLVISNEIRILDEIVDFIEQAAGSFQEALNKYNQPFIDKIKALQPLGEKTKEDQEEAYKQIISLIYPYFQMICQNLKEAKFQYESK